MIKYFFEMGRDRGFTLIEMAVVAVIIGLLAALGTPYLFGAREKVILLTERDRMVGVLETAKQQAVGAYRGNDYSVVFEINPPAPSSYRVDPDGRPTLVSKGVRFVEPSAPASIKFLKLTGKPEDVAALPRIVIETNRYETEILINSEGLIDEGELKRK